MKCLALLFQNQFGFTNLMKAEIYFNKNLENDAAKITIKKRLTNDDC